MLYIYICIYNLLCVLEYLSGTHNSVRVDISAVNSSDICIYRANNCVGITKQQSSQSSQLEGK